MVLWGHNQLNVQSKKIIATSSMIILMILGTLSCEELMDADIDKTDNDDKWWRRWWRLRCFWAPLCDQPFDVCWAGGMLNAHCVIARVIFFGLLLVMMMVFMMMATMVMIIMMTLPFTLSNILQLWNKCTCYLISVKIPRCLKAHVIYIVKNFNVVCI